MALRSFNGLLHGGIGYLHSQGPIVFHGKIKSTSVLLTTSYDPSVSDYGLNRIQAPPKDALKAADPQKDDVCSFGVLIVELLTETMPGEADFAYLFNSTTERRWDVDDFDPELGNYQNFQDELMGLLQVAMACASNLPQR
ncbi:hypothetical protein ACJRO7_014682 [Eucalyptus globulus]|uniref:Protein kinase domain-containing protein n=1 Tax=Eucalyptus globulus TaxID=34317 RepID=A0ABD3L0Z6_EUCGL